MLRRLLAGLAAAFALAAAPALAQERALEARITIHADQPGAQISRYLYGQFAEHLGSGIYDGVWVGPNSHIPNTRGIRNDVVAALRAIQTPVVRWPGGCFADIYHWRDGIGAQRPVTLNKTWGNVEESNAFGTHEYFDFLSQIGADAYIAIDVGSGNPQEMADWVEYMTSTSHSTLAELRRHNGHDAPFPVKFLAIGNETWGCGGNMRPEYYADLYRRFATYVHATGDQPQRIASGGLEEDVHWTDTLLGQAHQFMDGYSLHYYTIPTGNWEHKGAALGFPEAEWISTFKRTMRIEDLIALQTGVMDRSDPQHKVGLYIDEWGAWYDPAPGSNSAFLVQQNTLRDALLAGVNFNIFHAHADRVRMANIAQMTNVLQAMILTDGPRMVRTPTYYAFQMYTPFHDATSLPLDLTTPNYTLGDTAIPALSASAARGADGKVHVALINLDPHRRISLSGRLAGLSSRRVSGQILTAEAMDAHNTFEAPNTLVPTAFNGASVSGDRLSVTLPAKSLVVLTLN